MIFYIMNHHDCDYTDSFADDTLMSVGDDNPSLAIIRMDKLR